MSLPTRKIVIVTETGYNLKGSVLKGSVLDFFDQVRWAGDRGLQIENSLIDAIGVYKPVDFDGIQDVVFISNGICCQSNQIVEDLTANQQLLPCHKIKLRHYKVLHSSEKPLAENQWDMIALAVESSNLFGCEYPSGSSPRILSAEQITLVAFLEEGESNTKAISLINKALKARRKIEIKVVWLPALRQARYVRQR